MSRLRWCLHTVRHSCLCLASALLLLWERLGSVVEVRFRGSQGLHAKFTCAPDLRRQSGTTANSGDRFAQPLNPNVVCLVPIWVSPAPTWYKTQSWVFARSAEMGCLAQPSTGDRGRKVCHSSTDQFAILLRPRWESTPTLGQRGWADVEAKLCGQFQFGRVKLVALGCDVFSS